MNRGGGFLAAQQGAVLLVALVLLLVITVLGATALRSASLEMRMATNSQERQQAFNAAEAALRSAEAWLDLNGRVSQASMGCSGEGCYSDACPGGRCFVGEWVGAEHSLCTRSPSEDEPVAVWEDAELAVWTTANRHVAVAVDGIEAAHRPRYIIEFQCFIAGYEECQIDLNGDCPAMFRITALGFSTSGRARTLVQSVYAVAQ